MRGTRPFRLTTAALGVGRRALDPDALCLKHAGKARWAEKTPRNISRIGAIFRYFPEARFVHVLRDGRDVACSLRTHLRHEVVDGRPVPPDTWKRLAGCARRWRKDIECSRPWWNDPRLCTLRYEDLVRNPESVLRRLMAFLGESWDDAMLAHAGDRRIFKRIAGELLIELGHAQDDDW